MNGIYRLNKDILHEDYSDFHFLVLFCTELLLH